MLKNVSKHANKYYIGTCECVNKAYKLMFEKMKTQGLF